MRTIIAAVAVTHMSAGAEVVHSGQAPTMTQRYTAKVSALAKSIKPRELFTTYGSGNFGEAGPASFYTIDDLPEPLASLKELPRPLKRVDLDLGPGRLGFTIDDVLTHEEADALSACAERILELNGHSRMAPGVQTPSGMRQNMAAHWYPARAAADVFYPALFARFKHLVPREIDHSPLYPALAAEKIASFKYDQGDRFNRHVDGCFPVQGANAEGDGVDTTRGVQSALSMLLYLSDEKHDGFKGGETRLWSADMQHCVDVKPKKGRALFFKHGSGADSVMHAGLPVREGSPKFIARINIVYGYGLGTVHGDVSSDQDELMP